MSKHDNSNKISKSNSESNAMCDDHIKYQDDTNTEFSPKNLRRSFAHFTSVDAQDLTSVQKKPYQEFLQKDVEPSARLNIGLQSVFNKVFPIFNHNKMIQLDFISYKLLEPKDDIDECKNGDGTYASPLQARFRRTIFAIDEQTKEKKPIDVCEQDVFLGAMPLMTPQATFIISGVERVIIFQLHRAPGVFFEVDPNRSVKGACVAKIIPNAGSWVEFEYGGAKDECFVRIDKKRRISTITFLMCLNSENYKEGEDIARSGMSKAEILALYYQTNKAEKITDGWLIDFKPTEWENCFANYDLIDGKTRKVLAKQGERITTRVLNEFKKQGIEKLFLEDMQFVGHYLSHDLVDLETGSIIANAGEELTYDSINNYLQLGLKHINFLSMNRSDNDLHWRDNVEREAARTREEALGLFYRVFRPGEHPSLGSAYDLFCNLLFNKERYDLSEVGRVRLNHKLHLDHPENLTVLTKEDLVGVIKRLLDLKAEKIEADDMDRLDNRRIRSAGELLETQCLVALNKIKRLIKEKMNISDPSQTTPHSLFNSLLFMASIREFFTKSQLSQFLEQTNPLSVLTHIRKVSSLGPGGLQRGSAVMEVRDAHISSHGKLCPIQTPEGVNIGLIHSPTVNAKVDKYGFLQGLYRKVVDGKVTDQTQYLSALDDQKYNIAYGDSLRDEHNVLIGDLIVCKKGDKTISVPKTEVDFIGSSVNHMISVSASLIPGFCMTDGSRNLMAANMQGQAVPQLFTQAPIVGTGMERLVMQNTQSCLYAKRAGVVMHVEGSRIVIKADQMHPVHGLVDIYKLNKYKQSNAGTCLNQIPVVKQGQRILEGQLIADGQSAQEGELALGANVRVAFLSDPGNFEDSIVISERLFKEDVFSSIHVQELEVVARDTQVGNQEITRDIPGIDAERLWHLDESGIVQKGTLVRPGMILVGRITPRLDPPVTGEDKLVRAIFKSAAANVKDDSLYVPAGVTGTVVDVKVFSRKSHAGGERAAAMQKLQLISLEKDRDMEFDALLVSFNSVYKELIANQTLAQSITIKDKSTTINILDKDTKLTPAVIENIKDYITINKPVHVKDESVQEHIKNLSDKFKQDYITVQEKFAAACEKLQAGIELQTGVLKIVKIYIAVKRNIQVGDKLAGRHGNKGIVSYCLPESEMPYTADGKAVDMILTPLGVGARMNLGQILEIHLGRASTALQEKLTDMLIAFSKMQLNLSDQTDHDEEEVIIQEEGDDQPAITLSSCKIEKSAHQTSITLSDIRKFVNDIYQDHAEYLNALSDNNFLKQALKFAKDGIRFATPVFAGANEDNVKQLLNLAGLSEDGKAVLYDGKTGEKLDDKVTIGSLYMLKLHHLVDDKMHARSIGPYSSVTLQPLGGKAQYGGQRAGEMEIWAFQAHGSASILLEMMTIKSDSVEGRVEAYKSITSGLSPNFVSTPAVFSVFIKELEALALKIECKQRAIPLRDGWKRDYDTERISIRLQSPEEIRKNSFGEVLRPETINYRTQKVEPDGLFCAKIFGPVRDFECSCGKYKKMKDKGRVCDKCGVEVTRSWVRRERMGHINLSCAVLHPWFYRILPSKICYMLDMNFSDVDSVINMDKYIVVDPGLTLLAKKQLLTEHELEQAKIEHGYESFVALTGAEAILEIFKQMDLAKESENVRRALETTTVALRRKKLVTRLKLIEGFISAKLRPEWMVLTVIPVLPADLRPLVPIEAGRFASSDLNELYRRTINRVRRLERLVSLRAPEILIKSEKRLLQEAVDNLFDNGRRERPVLGSNRRPLRSLSDSLKGKQGIFRQNLLGKRVDYSGRSVIAVDAGDLKLHQCGLPKAMALELFKPFVYARLLRDGVVLTLRDAKKIVDEERPEVWDVLKEVVYRHPVLLNRAPTLHRLSMRAFEPVLVDGKAIRLHPLVCEGYNADFDGDQIAVHVPLSNIAQMEARLLMGAAVNQLKPSDGRSTILPVKDMILGMYYLTCINETKGDPNKLKRFYSIEEIIAAKNAEKVDLQERVLLYLTHDETMQIEAEKTNNVHSPAQEHSDSGRFTDAGISGEVCIESISHDEKPTQTSINIEKGGKWVETSPGRAILFNAIDRTPFLPFEMLNKEIRSKDVRELFSYLYTNCGQAFTGKLADDLKDLGFEYSKRSGISLALSDLKAPANKDALIKQAEAQEQELYAQYYEGLLTESERYNKVQELWVKCIDNLSVAIIDKMSELDKDGRRNPIYSMVDSGARGTKQQLIYMIGMRGLVAKISGELLESPVKECYYSGLTEKSFSNTVTAVRKNGADTALKTAVAGYLTRRLVDVAQDVVITEQDCHTVNGLDKAIVFDGETIIAKLEDRVLGRVLATDVFKDDGTLLVSGGTLLEKSHLQLFNDNQIVCVKVRSVLTCQAKEGVCSACYGIDIGTQKMIATWSAIGVIAAQSISEPGTQLTMNSRHVGVKKEISNAFFDAQEEGVISFRNHRFIKNRNGVQVVIKKGMEILLIRKGKELAKYEVPYGAHLLVQEGQKVNKGDRLASWEPYIIPIITETEGIVKYSDLIDGVSIRQDNSAGFTQVIEWKKSKRELRPSIMFVKEDGSPILTEYDVELRYNFNVGTSILVKEGEKVYPGDLLAKFSMAQLKSSDITGGLPMVSQLFEASKPKNCAILSEINGTVRFAKDYRGNRRIIVEPRDIESDVAREYIVPQGAHLLVQEGHTVNKADMLVDGTIYACDVLRILGEHAMIEHFINAVQNVYRPQGIAVNEKHIEVIIKPMMQTVEIIQTGDSIYLFGERVDKDDFAKTNAQLEAQGKAVAVAQPFLQGISDRSLNKSSLAAAAFQDSIKYIANAACKGAEEEVSKNVKTAMMTGNYPEQGTGGYIYQMHKEIIAQEKADEENSLTSLLEQDHQINETFSV